MDLDGRKAGSYANLQMAGRYKGKQVPAIVDRSPGWEWPTEASLLEIYQRDGWYNRGWIA